MAAPAVTPRGAEPAAEAPAWVGALPSAFVEASFLGLRAWQWLGIAVLVAAALAVAVVLGSILSVVMRRLVARTRFTWDDRLLAALTGPGRLLLGLATFAAGLPPLALPQRAEAFAEQVLRVLSVAAFTWVALRAVRFLAEVAGDRVSQRGGDDLSLRGTRTQIQVLRRVAWFVVFAIGGALVLFQFEALRALGTSLLASAGVAGLVVGLAAQRSIGTLLAGLQLSFTRPVRVGDVVIVEGEWGTVEEITLTYVVVKIWDLRRLVVPITRFLEAPFQNWTRTGTELLGAVFLHADYRVPVGAVRAELERFVGTRPDWDGKVVSLQVTEATAQGVQLRALVSASDSGKAWDLRCAVREHLVGFLQQLDGGRFLPRTRIEPEMPGAHVPRA